MRDLSLPYSIGMQAIFVRPGMIINMPMRPQCMIVNLVGCLLCVPIMSACAAGPDSTTSGEKSSPLAGMKPFESGTMTAAGVYIPSDAERALECKKLTGSMRVIIIRLRDTGNRPQPSLPASAAQSIVSAVRGRPSVLDMTAEDKRERGRLVAYNGLLAEKKCATLDLAKELPPATKK